MILCCGEALIDMVPSDPSADHIAFAPLAGGAIFNTARALGRLQVPVMLFSGISNDLFGNQLAEALQASNVNTELLVRSNRPTTLAFVKLTNGHAEYTFYDENSAGRMIEQDDIPELDTAVTTCYFGGISLCAEPAATTYEMFALREANHRVLMIDPNIRPGFIENESVYRARLSRLMSVADIVKVSDDDLDWIIPEELDQEAKLAKLQHFGAKLVILTKGSAGAEAYVNSQRVAQASVPKVTVVDTVGAGDTFNAGFLAYLQKNELLEKAGIAGLTYSEISNALDYATKVAAITVSRTGADPPLLSEM